MASSSKPSSKKEQQSQANYKLGLLGDTLSGFAVWSFLNKMPDAVFFPPMVAMRFTGYELLLFFFCLTSFLGIPSFRRWCARNAWLLQLLTLTGPLAYAGDNGDWIIVCACTACALSLIALYATWFCGAERRERSTTGLVLGLATFLIYRFVFKSVDPSYYYFGNSIFFAGLILLGCYISFIFRSENDIELGTLATDKKTDSSLSAAASSLNSSAAASSGSSLANSWFKVGISFGSLIFSIVHLLGGYGTLARWVGVYPFPWGALTIVAILAGMLIDDTTPVAGGVWWAAAFIGSLFLLYAPPTLGYIGGLVLGAYLCSQVRHSAAQLTSVKNPGKAIGISCAWFSFNIVCSVYVVAFPFVPMGFLMRERADFILWWCLGGMALTLIRHPFNYGLKNYEGKRTFPAFKYPDIRRTAATIVLALVVLAVAYRTATRIVPESQLKEDGKMSAMIWTLHFGYSNEGLNNMDEVVRMVKEAKTDVLGVLESDTAREYFGNRDLPEYLAEQLGMIHTSYGPATRTSTWGCALFSVYPIKWYIDHIMPSPEGEVACLIEGVLDVNGTDVAVIVAHFGNTEHVLDRQLQSEMLRDIAAQHSEPTVFLGYLTTTTDQPNFGVVTSTGLEDSAPYLPAYREDGSPMRYCQYILTKNAPVDSFRRQDPGVLSDTEYQYATFDITGKKSARS